MALSRADFNPRGFHEIAVSLWEAHPGDERYLRTVIGRAYYACFHLARMGLERNGRWSAGSTNAHERVLAELRRRGKFGLFENLRALRRLREQADYGLHELVDAEACDIALTRASRLLRLLATF